MSPLTDWNPIELAQVPTEFRDLLKETGHQFRRLLLAIGANTPVPWSLESLQSEIYQNGNSINCFWAIPVYSPEPIPQFADTSFDSWRNCNCLNAVVCALVLPLGNNPQQIKIIIEVYGPATRSTTPLLPVITKLEIDPIEEPEWFCPEIAAELALVISPITQYSTLIGNMLASMPPDPGCPECRGTGFVDADTGVSVDPNAVYDRGGHVNAIDCGCTDWEG